VVGSGPSIIKNVKELCEEKFFCRVELEHWQRETDCIEPMRKKDRETTNIKYRVLIRELLSESRITANNRGKSFKKKLWVLRTSICGRIGGGPI